MVIAKDGKHGPIKVVKGKGRANGIEVPIYASKTPAGNASFLAIYYDETEQRQRKRFPSKEKAIEHAEKVIETFAKKTPSVAAFTAEEMVRICDAIRSLQNMNLKLSEAIYLLEYASKTLETTDIRPAVDHYKAYLEERTKSKKLNSISVQGAVTAFIDHLKVEGKSQRDIYDVTSRLKHFSESFQCDIDQVKTVDIDRYLLEGNLSKKTRKNNRTSIVRLFAFARGKGFLPREKETEAHFATTFRIKPSERSRIEIYTVEQMQFLLSNIDVTVLPFVVLGAFAGLRSAEIARLDWKDIQFERGQGVIDLTARITKTASRRLVNMQPVLKTWLRAFRKKSGKVMNVRDENHLSRIFRNAVDRLVDEKGKPLFKTVHNGLRHSFISYFYALTDDVKLTAKQAGNSPDIIFANYNEPVTKIEGERWFNLMPAACGVFVDQSGKLLDV